MTDFAKQKDVDTPLRGVFRKWQMKPTPSKRLLSNRKYMSILTNEIQSSGQLYFKKENKLKWAYTEPFLYTIILNGKEIIIDDAGKINSFEIEASQAFKQINEIIINSVRGDVLQEDQFDIEYLENGTLYLCKLRPKSDQMTKLLRRN